MRVLYQNDKGVYHFDIKPANILIKKDGDKYVYKITDFGLSAMITDKNKHTLGDEGTIKFSHVVNEDTGDEEYGYETNDYIPDFLGDTLYFRDLYALYCTLFWVYNNYMYNSRIDKTATRTPIEQSQEDNAEESENEDNSAESYIKNYKNVLYRDMKHKSNDAKYNYINTILAHLSVLQIKLVEVYHGGKYKVLKTKRDAELKLYRDFYDQIN